LPPHHGVDSYNKPVARRRGNWRGERAAFALFERERALLAGCV
jgi:hypothetical protein